MYICICIFVESNIKIKQEGKISKLGVPSWLRGQERRQGTTSETEREER